MGSSVSTPTGRKYSDGCNDVPAIRNKQRRSSENDLQSRRASTLKRGSEEFSEIPKLETAKNDKDSAFI